MKLTAVIEKSNDGWFVGQIEQIPSAISQGKTLEELRLNLIDALKLLLETNKEEIAKDYIGKEIIREEIFFEE